ncbi:MAG: ABC transporter permease [Gammaproteobacteria bacterium]|nr:ABC transporter permease [Gammaproteobacteria bacterium]
MLGKIFVNFFKRCASCSRERLYAVVVKEFIQMMRDRVTFAMVMIIPLMQLILFGYAINTDPKHLPTVVLSADYSPFTRAFLYGLKNTDYFKIREDVKSESAAKRMLEIGETQFIISIPVDFTKKLLHGERPELLVEADATDPVATSSALSAVQALVQTVFNPLLVGALYDLRSTNYPVNIITHANYNPENITQYNIVPGLVGVVLTMTLVIITCMGITREREKGTLEHLLSTPVKPIEVMIGKILPYIIVGYIQLALILFSAVFLFAVPMYGSVILLVLASLPFIASNLAVGVTFSSLAKSQLQAAQMAMFFFLPSILLSGFMFPFRGMPEWAQYVGSILPLTYYLRIVRGIVLKGNGFLEIWPNLWPILIFMVCAVIIGLGRFRKTLD